jgi:hypothetical protein
LCQDPQRIGHESAESGNHDTKPDLSTDPSCLQERLVLHGVREGCYIVITVFEKEVIGANSKCSAGGYFRGLRPACMEWIERERSTVSGHLTDVRVSDQGVFQAA